MTTNYTEAFITVSPDSTATAGTTPTKAGSIAQIQHELLTRQPYHYTCLLYTSLRMRGHDGRRPSASGQLDLYVIDVYLDPWSFWKKRWFAREIQ